MVYYDRYMYLKISRLYWSILGMLYFTQFRMVINKLYPDRPYNTFSPLNSVNIIQLLLVLPELSFLFLFSLLKVTRRWWIGLKIAWSFMITSNLFNFITSTSTCRELRYLFRHTSQFNYLVISIFWIIPYQLFFLEVFITPSQKKNLEFNFKTFSICSVSVKLIVSFCVTVLQQI